ncbi:MAG: GIY-YIG nuclease family protein [Spirochaetia bacterium]|nr:GIY-YIG nuclease family protein [Spirochaetia bacterium]
MNLTYDRPDIGVFLRNLAYEVFIAKNKELKVKDLTQNFIQNSRIELGLKETKGGYAQTIINKLRQDDLISPSGTNPKPKEKEWEKEWRLLYLPPHNLVRELSFDPIIIEESKENNLHKFEIQLRNPGIPKFNVYIGMERPDKQNKDIEEGRGLYYLGKNNNEAIYIGQTSEFYTRTDDHFKKGVNWWILLVPQADKYYYLDKNTLDTSESLLISLWNEISNVTNQSRGSDTLPPFIYLQQAINITIGCSSIYLYLFRNKDKLNSLSNITINIPFKKWSGTDWPSCYINSGL